MAQLPNRVAHQDHGGVQLAQLGPHIGSDVIDLIPCGRDTRPHGRGIPCGIVGRQTFSIIFSYSPYMSFLNYAPPPPEGVHEAFARLPRVQLSSINN